MQTPENDPENVSPEDQLALDPTREERDRRAVRGGVVIGASQVVNIVLSMAATMLLARLLDPSDFGLLAMASIILTFVSKFSRFGIDDAVIQNQGLDSRTLSAIFWVNLKLSTLILLGLIVVAPLLMLLFGEPRLFLIVVLLAAANFIYSLVNVHEALIRRQMRFGTSVAINESSSLIGIIVAVSAAYAGWGYWALVLQEVVSRVVYAAVLLIVAGWKPTREGQDGAVRDRVRGMLRYGSNISAANVVAYLGRNIDYVLVGVMSGAKSLGLYHKAFRWASMPFQQVYLPAMQVAMTKFSRLQDSEDDYRRSVCRTMMTLYCVVTPLMVVLFIEARATILILLGNKWTEAIPLFQILLVGIFFHGIIQICKWIYKAEGRAGTFLRSTLVTSPGMAVGMIIGAASGYGPTGIAYGFVIACSVLALPTLYFCLRNSPLTMRDMGKAVWAPILASLLAGCAVWWFSQQLDITYHVPRVLVSGATVGLLFVILFLVLPGGRHRFKEIRIAFEPLLARKRGEPLEPSSDDTASRDNPLSP